MSTPSLPRRVAAFLHAVRSSPVEELRSANAALAPVPGDRLLAALAALDRVTREQGASATVRAVVDEARRVTELLGAYAHQRTDVLSCQHADQLQLLVERCAVALLVMEALPDDSFAVFWGPFAGVVSERLRDTRT